MYEALDGLSRQHGTHFDVVVACRFVGLPKDETQSAQPARRRDTDLLIRKVCLVGDSRDHIFGRLTEALDPAKGQELVPTGVAVGLFGLLHHGLYIAHDAGTDDDRRIGELELVGHGARLRALRVATRVRASDRFRPKKLRQCCAPARKGSCAHATSVLGRPGLLVAPRAAARVLRAIRPVFDVLLFIPPAT